MTTLSSQYVTYTTFYWLTQHVICWNPVILTPLSISSCYHIIIHIYEGERRKCRCVVYLVFRFVVLFSRAAPDTVQYNLLCHAEQHGIYWRQSTLPLRAARNILEPVFVITERPPPPGKKVVPSLLLTRRHHGTYPKSLRLCL